MRIHKTLQSLAAATGLGVALLASGAMAQQAEAPQPVVTKTEISNFENWSVICRNFSSGKRLRVCTAQLQVVQGKDARPVLIWSLFFDDDGKELAVLQTPTGVTIDQGVAVKLSKSGAARKIPFATCDNGFCTANIAVDTALTRELASSAEAEIVVISAAAKAVTFKFPVKGFDKAREALGSR